MYNICIFFFFFLGYKLKNQKTKKNNKTKKNKKTTFDFEKIMVFSTPGLDYIAQFTLLWHLTDKSQQTSTHSKFIGTCSDVQDTILKILFFILKIEDTILSCIFKILFETILS